ncbi:hypothetical protein [uncultured Pontibacter sp.]|uniref:hypothetical protein n=1 Tax=uncultured Pontibacter sp. TaxID=453356 RepID=UPI00261876E3|nr:hypothetical protein [uncultured Pontibacter sp.]
MERDITRKPNKANLAFQVLTWLIGSGLLLYVTTNNFQVSPLQKKNFLLGILFLISTASTLQAVRNYFSVKKV